MLRTWDIFDTLIARRCIFPQAVFRIVEQISKIGGFAQVRIIAERVASSRGQNCTLDLIYDELQRITRAPKNICDVLKKLECDIELDQSIPITENIRQVRAGDILISDMYLPEDVVRRLLAKAGLIEPVEIVITSGGKSSGRIWKQLAEQKTNIFHIGDNEISDLTNPRKCGLDSMLDVRSRPNAAEQFLMQHDFNFAAYLREIRLRNPFREELKRRYWEIFTLNIGILILLVRQLDDLQKKHGFEYLGFCGRDTHYLRLLYEKFKYDIGEKPVPNDYLYYSRKLLAHSKDDAAKYFRAKINNRKALLLDLIGTGATLHGFRSAVGGACYSILICCHYGKKFTEKYCSTASLPEKWISFLDNPDMPTGANDAFYFVGNEGDEQYITPANEVFNRATHNSPIRLNLVQIAEKILPNLLFSQVSDTENLDVFEACLHEVLNSKVHWSALRRKDIIKHLLKIFATWTVPVALRSQHVLEESADGIAAKLSKK